MNIGIIFAGGTGNRMGAELPKQFIMIEGKPIIIHTLQIFDNHPEIDAIYIASVEDYIDKLDSYIKTYGIKKVKGIVPGGDSALDSAYNALKAAEKDCPEDSIVLIHDGVRPRIPNELISQNIADVKDFGSSITCTLATETPIHSPSGDVIENIPPRHEVYMGQAPQAFYLKDILEAHENKRGTKEGYGKLVDSCNLYRSLGKEAHITIGNSDNIKATTPKDLAYLKTLFSMNTQEMLKSELTEVIDEDIQDILLQEIDFEKMQGSTVLITGANGMIGSYFIYTLLGLNDTRNYDIKILALMRDKNRINKYFKGRKEITVLEQDVVDPIHYHDKIDYIIHAASPASPKIMKDSPIETSTANYIGAYNTLKLAQKNQATYIYISSREVYGEPLEHQELFTENDYGFVNPLDARSCYPEAKKAAENLCVSFKDQHGVDVKIIRPAHTYGPGMTVDDGRVQADFLRNVLNDQDIIMKSKGEQVRTYSYISDVTAGAFWAILNGDEVVYNVADDSAIISIADLAELLVKLRPEKKLKVIMDIPEEALKGTAVFVKGTMDCTKLRELGWKPTYSLEEGFDRTLEHLEIKKIK